METNAARDELSIRRGHASQEDTDGDEVDLLRDKVTHLERALVSRAPIEQAKGMLMIRYGLSADRAFAALSRWSQDSNVKLHDLATALVETGTEEGSDRVAGADPTAPLLLVPSTGRLPPRTTPPHGD